MSSVGLIGITTFLIKIPSQRGTIMSAQVFTPALRGGGVTPYMLYGSDLSLE